VRTLWCRNDEMKGHTVNNRCVVIVVVVIILYWLLEKPSRKSDNKIPYLSESIW